METISRFLLTFLLNSLWQIPLTAAVASLTGWLMRHSPASHRHIVWVAALATALLLPVASIHSNGPATTPQFDASLAARDTSATGSGPRLSRPAQLATRTPVAR